MSSFIGLDVQEVRNLSRQLHDASGQIENLANQLTGQLSGTQWVGPDATAFRGQWDSHQSALKSVATALSDASLAATRNADQQEQASA